jgi:adenylate cyclase
MPMVIPLGVTVLGITGALALQYELEGRQHRFIKEAFRHYVSPSVIDQIVADPTSLALGGVRRELTIFFSDIAGFTTISEQIEAAQLSALLNRFLSEMTEVILRSGGTVDKYVGDAIVAFWNAPLEVTDHATRGVLAALACQARLGELQEEFQRNFGVSIRMRVGLHTGVVSVGNFGSRERFNYTMIGDAANLASRLEGANKYFGTDILVSAATRERVGSGVLFRKVADIQVVGKSEVTTVFEPYRAATDFSPRYEEALELFEAGDRLRAAELFRTLPSDAVARAYLARIEREAGAPAKGTGWILGEK